MSSGCRVHVKAIGDNQECVTIESIDSTHTCGTDAPRRKRDYSVRDLSEASDVLNLCSPTATKAGNTKQHISMTKAATGVTLETGQAAKAVRSKVHDSIEAQIGQCLLIPSSINAHKSLDPDGVHRLEHKQCTWDNTKRQFVRCFLCVSIAIHFHCEAGMRFFVCDGTFTRSIGFKHIILVAVTFDGNNQIVTLAFATVDVENADNWVWFKELPCDCFPGF